MVDDELEYSNVTILIPTLNEEATIGQVVSGFVDLGCDNILVIDGRSEDDTQQVARDAGAEVMVQQSSGKGAAVREAVQEITTEYLVMIDGDATYDPQQLDRILLPLYQGYDEVLGNRFADMKPNAMTTLHKFGNFCINFVFFCLTGHYVNDLLTGYRGYRTKVIHDIGISEDRFGVETELTTKVALSEYSNKVVPITYNPRPVNSEANLNSFGDGFDIFRTLVELRLKHF